MRDFSYLQDMNERSLAQQAAVRKATFSPSETKQLRPFSIWEISSFMFDVPADTLRKKLAEDPSLPQGVVEEEGRQRWFTLAEINELRRRVRFRGKKLLPERPKGRALRVAVSNFKGGVGKTVVAQHLANAAALDGYRVLVVDFDPQATLTHSMGLVEVKEWDTVWGIMCRDLCKEADRIMEAYDDPADCPYPAADELPKDVQEIGTMRVQDFIQRTAWSTIDIIPSCANAAFVEFASAQYRSLHKAWSFFGCVARYLDELPEDQYDLVIFDCPPAIGYQSLNAAFAADVLYIPSGPGYWEYDSTTSFLGQLGDALQEISDGFERIAADAGIQLPKRFVDIRVLMTRFEVANPLHVAMLQAFRNVFGADVCQHPIEMTRAVEQSGRFQMSVYEQDYREMTRETWKRARQSFDNAYAEFKETILKAWKERNEMREVA
ncbi:AAA family ATPase [Rhodobacter sphaeroides]|jgi:cellulose biosynthesis protein BcsQ|uniref:RepA partitioning protein/ATPase, ParA type n=1 Tax=Cereibacter sphaeroides (strain ATCC 17023 / DSM 158 / JCM 6121 / CCUG 31486 / LMG 2827 / NBRC 12203 / NCIMB 8253 / ATH 2.4.1.) TaxID=272943 RepID=Q3IV52_CERS4|nr:AAA family ATPase [Cereibacter sphaeroides]ABA81582.1 RepA partitioning protein/ATPase, ParA type [Cereibacter sphaeroides 2.4.1]AXC64010.1 chromosome partitioning protein ParA [Cereibacter sphaeroides 2.4.1]MVX50452.1 AAA family ATPase [Cereibacter sphaeroides]QHA15451.1 AAA family ATPase [Cereibacter sphaeroides]GEM94680.1 chromosome partitioning protein ParA [Cereibacter sphaeroides]